MEFLRIHTIQYNRRLDPASVDGYRRLNSASLDGYSGPILLLWAVKDGSPLSPLTNWSERANRPLGADANVAVDSAGDCWSYVRLMAGGGAGVEKGH